MNIISCETIRNRRIDPFVKEQIDEMPITSVDRTIWKYDRENKVYSPHKWDGLMLNPSIPYSEIDAFFTAIRQYADDDRSIYNYMRTMRILTYVYMILSVIVYIISHTHTSVYMYILLYVSISIVSSYIIQQMYVYNMDRHVCMMNRHICNINTYMIHRHHMYFVYRISYISLHYMHASNHMIYNI